MVSGGGTAVEAGIKSGDRILSINGTNTNNAEEVISIIRENANTELEVSIERKGEIWNIQVYGKIPLKEIVIHN